MRRIQKLVDHEVQSSLARRLVLHWVLFMLAIMVGALMWVRLIEAPTATWAEVLRIGFWHLTPVVVISIAIVPMFIKDAIGLSNRFAGPIIRVRRALADYADGKSTEPVEFRHGDFWKSLAHEVNRAISKPVGKVD